MAFNIRIRQLGQIADAAARLGQSLYRTPPNTIAGVNPTNWPTANQPVQPIGPPGSLPLAIPYQIGQNLTYTPRFDSPVSAAELRALATYPLARICIENTKDQLCQLPWKIQLRQLPGETIQDVARRRKTTERGDVVISTISKFLEYPDGEKDWSEWIRNILDDMLVIDAASIEIRKKNNGQLAALDWLPGDNITRYIDDTGRTPKPPSPAYVQLWEGIPRVPMTTDQLIYRPRNIVPRNTVSSYLYGYCYSSDTEILTRDRGWVTFENLNDTDLVATRSRSKAFEWQKPTSRIVQNYCGDMYHFSSPAVDVMVTPDHRMLVSFSTLDGGKPSRKERVVSAKELAAGHNHERKLPMTSTWDGVEIGEKTFVSNHSTDMYDFRISGDDYCALLGAYLSEGNIRYQGGIEINQLKEKRGRINPSWQLYHDLMERVNGKALYVGNAFVLARRSITDHFRKFGHARTKYIPEEIRNTSVRQLSIFWEYFIAGDGNREPRGKDNYRRDRDRVYTSSKTMAGQFVEIAQKLGWSAAVRRDDGRPMKCPNPGKFYGKIYQGNERFTINVRYANNMYAPVKKVTYDGSVYCVSVPNGIVYVRRNGKPVWCGNSPVEQVAQEIRIGMARLEFVWAYYKTGSIPNAIHVVPAHVTVDNIREAMNWVNSELSGNLDARRTWRMIQGFAKEGKEDQIIFPKEPVLADVFDDLHIRKLCFAFGTSPMRLQRMMNRGSAQQSQQSNEDESIRPWMNWIVKAIINPLLRRMTGDNMYEMELTLEHDADQLKQVKIDDIKVSKGHASINEIRRSNGEDPDPDPAADELAITTPTGRVPIGLLPPGMSLVPRGDGTPVNHNSDPDNSVSYA